MLLHVLWSLRLGGLGCWRSRSSCRRRHHGARLSPAGQTAPRHDGPSRRRPRGSPCVTPAAAAEGSARGPETSSCAGHRPARSASCWYPAAPHRAAAASVGARQDAHAWERWPELRSQRANGFALRSTWDPVPTGRRQGARTAQPCGKGLPHSAAAEASAVPAPHARCGAGSARPLQV